MRYLVYGTGAVGGLLGARLAMAGFPVVCLARPRVAEAVLSEGLRLQDRSGPIGIARPTVVHRLSEAFDQPASPEVILLTVKAFDCAEAAQALAAAAPASVPVVSLLNGIGNEDVLARHVGAARVIPAVLTTAVTTPDPGLVRIERERGVSLASGHPILPRLASDLRAARFRVRLHRDPVRMKWSKLFTNLVGNATSAILDWPPGDVFGHRDLYRLEVEALRETLRVMRGLGLRPENLVGVPLSLLRLGLALPTSWSRPFLRRVVTSGRGSKRPSLSYDIGRGRSEVSWLNGAVEREGARLQIPTPANAVLAEVMLGLVEGREQPESFWARPEVLLARAEQSGVPGIQGYNPGAGSAARRRPRARL